VGREKWKDKHLVVVVKYVQGKSNIRGFVSTVDVLNFSKRVREVFGPNLLYAERTDPQRIEGLVGLPLASEN
jgi:hypothetical protein